MTDPLLSSKVIAITEEQLELCIEDGIQKLAAQKAWIAPLSFFIPLLLALVTVDFKDFPWVAGKTLKGFFSFLAVLSFLWLVRSLFQLNNFGRKELMASIRAAGTQYRVSATIDQSGLQDAGLQCRQCGKLLQGAVSGQTTRCPVCGTAS